jgi:hypothetical protein
MKQPALKGFEKYGKTTRRAVFLAEMDRVMPSSEVLTAPPMPLARILRTSCCFQEDPRRVFSNA